MLRTSVSGLRFLFGRRLILGGAYMLLMSGASYSGRVINMYNINNTPPSPPAESSTAPHLFATRTTATPFFLPPPAAAELVRNRRPAVSLPRHSLPFPPRLRNEDLSHGRENERVVSARAEPGSPYCRRPGELRPRRAERGHASLAAPAGAARPPREGAGRALTERVQHGAPGGTPSRQDPAPEAPCKSGSAASQSPRTRS